MERRRFLKAALAGLASLSLHLPLALGRSSSIKAMALGTSTLPKGINTGLLIEGGFKTGISADFNLDRIIVGEEVVIFPPGDYDKARR